MNVTLRFGRVTSSHTVEFAPRVFREDGITYCDPDADFYRARGWLPIVDKAPDPEEGHYVVKTGLADEVDGKVVTRYEQVPLPLEVHTYKKSYLAQWMLAHDRWYSFKTIAQSDPDLAFFWETSTEFDSDHPRWAEILAGLKTALQLTDEDVEEMLAYGERGGVQTHV